MEPAFVRRFLVQRGKRARPRTIFVRLASAVLLAVARAYSRKGRLGATERAYRRLLSIHPNQPKIWVQYGHTIKERGDLAAAAGAYGTAFRLAPEDDDARRQYGIALDRLGCRDEAGRVLSGADRPFDPSGA